MSNVIIPATTRTALRTLRVFRNGLYPEAGPQTRLMDEANRIVALRGKQWTFASPCPSVPAAGGASTQRWRTFIHTSTHHAYINARFLCMPSNNAGTPVSLVTFTEVGGGVVGSCEHRYGAFTGDDNADNMAVGQSRTIELAGTASVELDPDTDYEVNVYDLDNARTMAVSLFEHALPYTTANGYVNSAGVVAGQPILDVHRSGPTTVLRNAWLSNGSPLITFSTSLDSAPLTRTSATIANLLDGVTGSPTAATAGFTLSLANRSTLRRAADGIPVIMRAYGKCAGGGSGHVYLTNSAGTDVIDTEIDTTTEGWYSSGPFNLPATDGKYDLRFGGDGTNLLTVRAVALYSIE